MEQGVVESEATRVPNATMRFAPMSDKIAVGAPYFSVEDPRHPTSPMIPRNPLFLTCADASKSTKMSKTQLVSTKDLDSIGMIPTKNLDTLLVVIFSDFEFFVNGGYHFIIANDCRLVNIHSRKRVERSHVQVNLVFSNWLSTFKILLEFLEFLTAVRDNDSEQAVGEGSIEELCFVGV